MSDIINRTTLEFRRSQNGADFPDPPWQHNPDMTGVEGWPPQYWKWDVPTDSPVVMTELERAAVDAVALEVEKQKELIPLALPDYPDLLRSLAIITRLEINTLRTEAGLAERTVAQWKAQLKGHM